MRPLRKIDRRVEMCIWSNDRLVNDKLNGCATYLY